RLGDRPVGAASLKLVLERADPLGGRESLLLPAGEALALIGKPRGFLGVAPPAPLGLQALDPCLCGRGEVARPGRLLARGVELVPRPHLLPRPRLERPELGAELGVRAGGERALCLGAGFLEDGRALVLASGGKRRRVEVVAGEDLVVGGPHPALELLDWLGSLEALGGSDLGSLALPVPL